MRMIWGLFFIFADKGMTFMLFWDYIPFFFNSSSFSVRLSLSPLSVVRRPNFAHNHEEFIQDDNLNTILTTFALYINQKWVNLQKSGATNQNLTNNPQTQLRMLPMMLPQWQGRKLNLFPYRPTCSRPVPPLKARRPFLLTVTHCSSHLTPTFPSPNPSNSPRFQTSRKWRSRNIWTNPVSSLHS